MNEEDYIKDLFDSIPDYRKIVLLMFLIKNDNDLLHEIGFGERDINHIKSNFKNVILEQIYEYYSYIKNKEESIIEKFINK